MVTATFCWSFKVLIRGAAELIWMEKMKEMRVIKTISLFIGKTSFFDFPLIFPFLNALLEGRSVNFPSPLACLPVGRGERVRVRGAFVLLLKTTREGFGSKKIIRD